MNERQLTRVQWARDGKPSHRPAPAYLKRRGRPWCLVCGDHHKD